MAEGRLWQLAELDGMPSAPTLRKLIRDRPDFPLIERGRRGREYRIDLDQAAAFVREHWRDERTLWSGKARVGRVPNEADQQPLLL